MAVTYPILSLVSESTTPDQTGNGQSMLGVGGTQALSANGRYVVFTSEATDLLAGGNSAGNIFVRDLETGTVTLVSVGTEAANNVSSLASISDDGRYVVFRSSASNLVAGDTNGSDDIFVKDLQTGDLTRVSLGDDESQIAGGGNLPVISGNGRYVTFTSSTDGIVSGDSDATSDVFRRDLQTGATVLVSQDETGVANFSALSTDGRYVAYHNGADLKLRDMESGTTSTIASDADIVYLSVSGNGQYVVFTAMAHLAGTDTNPYYDVYRYDRLSGTTVQVSVGAAGESLGHSIYSSISDDGRYVAFSSGATNIVVGDTNGLQDIFIRDMETGTTTKVDNTAGAENVFLSGDGSTIAFDNWNAISGTTDGNGALDVVAIQMSAPVVANEAPEFTSAATATVSENSSFVIDLAATDAESAESELTYVISGTDAELFTFDSVSREISFIEPPDYEEPLDSDGDNVYNLTVTVYDALGASTEQNLAISVSNVNGVTITGNGLSNTVNAVTTVAGKSRPTSEEDTITGLAGNDTLNGLAGNDDIDGGTGNDFITGGLGRDTLTGGDGNDTFIVDADDTIVEAVDEGTDSIRTTVTAYSLAELSEIEYLWYTQTADFAGTGNDKANRIWSGIGNDTLDGGIGADSLYGAAGNDTYVVDNALDIITDTLGVDTIETDLATYVMTTLSNVENLNYTGELAFTVTGNALNNVITGGDDNDVLKGAAGNDTLDGGLGDDAMTGGLGNDIFMVDSEGDVVIEAATGGTDNVKTTLSTYSLAALAAVENITYQGAEDFTGTGNALANRLVGGLGNDTLEGKAGRDTLLGGAGDDILNGGLERDWLTGGAGSDSFVMKDRVPSLNSDVIADFVAADDEIAIENGIFTALGAATGVLDSTKFWSSSTGLAHDATDRIVYNTTTGALTYDANGSAFGGIIEIALLTGKPTLTADDIIVI